MYSDTDIKIALQAGTIEISPYTPDNLQTNSYDVCLGNTFYKVFWDAEGPYFVGPYVYLDGEKVEIPVGGTLLGVTKERVGTFGKVVAEMRSKSSIRRIGIDPCMAAGWGDIGYNDLWVMEFSAFVRIDNYSDPFFTDLEDNIDYYDPSKPEQYLQRTSLYPPFLIIGQSVAQMIFYECKSKPTRQYNGQYKDEWPLNMIPKRYRHRVIAPKQKI